MKKIPSFEEFLNESQLNRLYEGHMSELIILAQDAKDYADFVKSAMKEYPQLKKEKDLEAWLKSIYDTAVNESVKIETIGDALDDQTGAAFDILWNIAKKHGKVKGLSKTDTKRMRPGYVNMFIEDLVDAGKIKLTDKIQESAEELPGAVHMKLGPKQGRVVISGMNTEKLHTEIINTVLAIDNTARLDFFAKTNKIVGVISVAKLKDIKKALLSIDKSLEAEIKKKPSLIKI